MVRPSRRPRGWKRAIKTIGAAVEDFCKRNPCHPLVEEFTGGAPFIRWKEIDRWLRDGGDISLLEDGGNAE